MNDRNRAAPITLAGDAPVAQAKVGLPFALRPAADGCCLEPACNLILGLFDAEPVEEIRIDDAPLAQIGLVLHVEGLCIRVGRKHHGYDAQIVFAREVQVALIVGGATENGAGAIVHEHEICDVNRQVQVFAEGMAGDQAGVVAELFGALDIFLARALAAAFGDEFLQCRILRSQDLCQRMVRGQRTEPGSEQGVGPCRIDLERFVTGGNVSLKRKPDQQPMALADPVLLHQPHLVRPALQRIQRLKQIVGEIRDLEEPLGQFALFHRSARPPTFPVDDLLVGKDRMVHRVPIHLGAASCDEALLQEIQEQLLLMHIVGRIAGGDFAIPVDGQPQ